MSNKEIPKIILDAANEATKNILPIKSKERYEKTYKFFRQWMLSQNVEIVNEDVMLAYLYEKSKTLKASSLWSTYSMLKHTIQINDNISINKYSKLLSFLKRQNDNYEPKKSKVLLFEHIQQFLHKAEDETYLLLKVAIIFGLNGACRQAELCKLNVNDIEDTGKLAIVTLNDTKTKKKRMFTISDDSNGYNFYKKYFNLRPKDITHNRFFIYFNKGKCTSQPVGINSFAKMPKTVAQYLNLEDYEKYTGHCFRRTSATLLADSGADVMALKRHGGWKSSSVAEGYVEDSVSNKIRTSKLIFQHADENTAINTDCTHEQTRKLTNVTKITQNNDIIATQTPVNIQDTNIKNNIDIGKTGSITFSNLNNCVFHIYNGNNK